jgi:hypothetical protein
MPKYHHKPSNEQEKLAQMAAIAPDPFDAWPAGHAANGSLPSQRERLAEARAARHADPANLTAPTYNNSFRAAYNVPRAHAPILPGRFARTAVARNSVDTKVSRSTFGRHKLQGAACDHPHAEVPAIHDHGPGCVGAPLPTAAHSTTAVPSW